ncbi:MAG: hypothetical protein MI862_17905 [Desulfobacterales bacterium]|nr:hypothetical protein [Desulfobacterales bacterium]
MERLYPLIRLLAYNIEVVIDLELPMVRAYTTDIDNTPFSGAHKIQVRHCPGTRSNRIKKRFMFQVPAPLCMNPRMQKRLGIDTDPKPFFI